MLWITVYGTPQDMCLDNLVKTEFFGPAVEAVVAKRKANARVKATSEDRCGEHGWKTSGGSRKTWVYICKYSITFYLLWKTHLGGVWWWILLTTYQPSDKPSEKTIRNSSWPLSVDILCSFWMETGLSSFTVKEHTSAIWSATVCIKQ